MELTEILSLNTENTGEVMPLDMSNFIIFDFSFRNKEILNLDSLKFNEYVKNILSSNKVNIGIGKYNEDRHIYNNYDLFKGVKDRTIHLGLDIFTNPGVDILAPIDGKIHSFKNNNKKGDYDPTIILEHKLKDIIFYTLYGHLTLDSIKI